MKDEGLGLKQCQGRYRDSKACTKHGPKGAFSETKGGFGRFKRQEETERSEGKGKGEMNQEGRGEKWRACTKLETGSLGLNDASGSEKIKERSRRVNAHLIKQDRHAKSNEKLSLTKRKE